MKKIALITLISIAFASCSKDEQVQTSSTQETVYLRVEAVSQEGDAIYSDVKPVRIK